MMEANELIIRFRNASDAYSKRRAAEELSTSIELNKEIIEALAEGLLDKDGGVKDLCSRALVNMPEAWKSTASFAIVPFIKHNDIEVRNLAGDILVRIGKSALDSLIPFLSDDDPDNRKFACDIIGLIGSPENGVYIHKLMEDEDVNVVSSSAEAVGNLKDDTAMDMLMDVYENYEELKPVVIDSIGKIGGRRAEMFLIDKMRTESDIFLKTATIDALAFCGEDLTISTELMNELPKVPEELQMILLKTIFAISFRQGYPLELPNDLKHIARRAMLEDDNDVRMAGLLALGNKYTIADVPGLVNEASRNNPDTQQLILNNLLAFSEVNACEEFFRVFYTVVDEDGSLFEITSYLQMLWQNAQAINAAATVNTIIDIIFDKPKEHSSQIVEVLLRLEKALVIDKIRESLYLGKAGQIKEALDLIQNLSLLKEFENDLLQLGSSNSLFTEQIQKILS